MHGNRFVCNALIIAAGLAFALPSAAVAPPEILVLSNRADLISGGDALVEIKWPAGASIAVAKIAVDGVSVKSAFATRANGRYMGVVTGLKIGNNVLTARVPGSGAQITINNHPIGGPVFSGPQLQPWICAMKVATSVTVTGNPGSTPTTATTTTRASGLSSDPTDAQCDTPPTFSYYYEPVAKVGTGCTFTITGANPCFVPYPTLNDPATRPANALIADFTNDRGTTVKSLIRVELGSLNRGLYQLVTFYDPLDANVPWAPPAGWNGKLVWGSGEGGSSSRFESVPATAIFVDMALSRGFMVASSSFTDNGTQSNATLAAETMMMTKERIVENYGEIRYTIGAGCSGGSIMQDTISSSYPGLFDGIQPNCVYSDMQTIFIEIPDCGLLSGTATQTSPGGGYYVRTGSPGLALSTAQQAAINGNLVGFCTAWNGSFLGFMNPLLAANCGSGFPAALMQSATNPNGVRCGLIDQVVNIVGSFVDTDGRTKANPAKDNIGVQYGLKALAAGTITPEQFVQLNEGIGGFNVDHVWTPSREVAGLTALQRQYSGGLVGDGRQWAKVPIINLRENNTLTGDIHANWRAWGQRERLDRDHGSHDNQVIWAYNSAGAVSGSLALKSFLTMDAWLHGIETDPSANPIEVKVVNNKPAAAHDRCYNTAATTDAQVDDSQDVGLGTPACLITFANSPRQAAGGPLAENIYKCQLKAFDPSSADYAGVAFTLLQQGRLAAVFPTGVCDWTQLGVGQVPVNPWTTFAGGPGGVPLGAPPVSSLIP